MNVLDLFCGAGGFSTGFKHVFPKATFVGVDKNLTACLTYSRNVGQAYCLDLTRPTCVDWLLDQVGHVDILIGSPPCPEFSSANRFRTLNTRLVEIYIEIKDRLEPRFWVMEESPGLASIGRAYGWFQPRFLKACDFGLPHVRRRLVAGNYPPPCKQPYKGKLVATPKAAIRGFGHGKDARARIRAFILSYKQQHGIPHKHDAVTFCDVITPAVYAHVMGFPLDYQFIGNKDEVYTQIGNAVCPPVSKAIADAIARQRRLDDLVG